MPTVGTINYDIERLVEDMTSKGWLPTDLARRAAVSDMTVSRFLKGHTQTARVAKKLARALGFSVRRYLVSAKAVAAEQILHTDQRLEAGASRAEVRGLDRHVAQSRDEVGVQGGNVHTAERRASTEAGPRERRGEDRREATVEVTR